MSIKSVMPSNHLILCRPLLLPPSIFPSIRVFSNESALHIMAVLMAVSVSECLCLVTQLCLTLCDPIDSSVYGDSSGKNTGLGCHALLQGVFSTY